MMSPRLILPCTSSKSCFDSLRRHNQPHSTPIASTKIKVTHSLPGVGHDLQLDPFTPEVVEDELAAGLPLGMDSAGQCKLLRPVVTWLKALESLDEVGQ